MNKGYIKLYRVVKEWAWYQDTNTFKLFIHLLLSANYETKKWKNETIKKGQLVTSVSHLVAETGLTTQEVRTSLDKLKTNKQITSKTTNKYTLITIVNWAKYQDSTENITNKKTETQQTTNNNIKNIRIKNKTYTNYKEEYKNKKSIKNKGNEVSVCVPDYILLARNGEIKDTPSTNEQVEEVKEKIERLKNEQRKLNRQTN